MPNLPREVHCDSYRSVDRVAKAYCSVGSNVIRAQPWKSSRSQADAENPHSSCTDLIYASNSSLTYLQRLAFGHQPATQARIVIGHEPKEQGALDLVMTVDRRHYESPRFEPGGREFESLRARQKIKIHSGHMVNTLFRRHGLHVLRGEGIGAAFDRPAF